jgi:hypothetical protein
MAASAAMKMLQVYRGGTGSPRKIFNASEIFLAVPSVVGRGTDRTSM